MTDGPLTNVTLSREKKRRNQAPLLPPPRPGWEHYTVFPNPHTGIAGPFKWVLFVFSGRSGVLYCACDVQGRVSATGPADDGHWSVALRRTGARVERTATEGSHCRSFTPVDRQRNVTRFDNTVVFFRYALQGVTRGHGGSILEFAETRDLFRRKIKTASYVRDIPFWT